MADGTPELVEIPCIYSVRHVPPRRKQAILTSIYEDAVVRVAGWSDSQAPVVARLQPGITTEQLYDYVRHGRDRPDFETWLGGQQRCPEVVYRAARGIDGIVRLVAPLDSAAFGVRGQPDEPGAAAVPARAKATLFSYPGIGVPRPRNMVRAGQVNLGTPISMDRGPAVVRTNGVARTMASIDGVLHAPCGEPGWSLNTSYYMGREASLHASPDILDYGNSNHYIACTPNPTELYEFLREADWQFKEYASGRLEMTQPHLLGADPWWRVLRGLLHGAVYGVGADTSSEFTCEESVLRARMMLALSSWPAVRDTALVRDAVRTIRVVHGIKAAGNNYAADRVLRLEETLLGTPPLDLQSRLLARGIAVGAVPDQALAGPAQR